MAIIPFSHFLFSLSLPFSLIRSLVAATVPPGRARLPQCTPRRALAVRPRAWSSAPGGPMSLELRSPASHACFAHHSGSASARPGDLCLRPGAPGGPASAQSHELRRNPATYTMVIPCSGNCATLALHVRVPSWGKSVPHPVLCCPIGAGGVDRS